MTTFTMETAHTLHVTVYTKDNCQQCAATERALNRIGLDYREIKINEAVRIGQPHFVKDTNFLRSVFSAQGLLVDLRQTSMGGFAVFLVQIQTRAVHGRHDLIK